MIVSRRASLLEAEVDGEVVALDVDSGRCYGFNATATEVWKHIAEPMRLSALRDALTDRYEVDAETCELQLRELLAELERDGLVELRPHDGSADA